MEGSLVKLCAHLFLFFIRQSTPNLSELENARTRGRIRKIGGGRKRVLERIEGIEGYIFHEHITTIPQKKQDE